MVRQRIKIIAKSNSIIFTQPALKVRQSRIIFMFFLKYFYLSLQYRLLYFQRIFNSFLVYMLSSQKLPVAICSPVSRSFDKFHTMFWTSLFVCFHFTFQFNSSSPVHITFSNLISYSKLTDKHKIMFIKGKGRFKLR